MSINSVFIVASVNAVTMAEEVALTGAAREILEGLAIAVFL